MTSLQLSRKRTAIAAFLVFLGIMIIAMIFLSSPRTDSASADRGDGECRSCHDNIKIYSVEADAVSEVALGPGFDYKVTITNPDGNDGNPHDLNNIELRLEIQGENITLAHGETADKTMDNITGAGTNTISWRLDAVSTGNATLKVFTEGIAHYDHDKDKNPDDYRYSRNTPAAAITVKRLSVSFSNYSFSVIRGERKEFEVSVKATENITNFKAWIPGDLEGMLEINSSHANWTGAGASRIGAGEELLLQIIFSGEYTVSDHVVFSWRNSTGELQTIRIGSRVTKEAKGTGDTDLTDVKISRILGYISAVTLISLFISGCRRPGIKKRMNSICGGAKKRLRLHCWVSYFALVTGGVHGLIWILKRKMLFLDDSDVILGDIAVFGMVMVALNGIFQRRIVKRFGFRKWHLFHLIGSITALVTAMIHILRLNTYLGFNI